MDSQGFVSLKVIAEFRRIKALLGDSSMSYGQLRDVAQQVRNAEHVIGEDGEDRLRSRENWRDFVLPIEERLPQAQHDGPKVRSNYPRQSASIMPDFQMSNGLRSAPPNVNGFHEAYPNHAHHYQQEPVHERQSTEEWVSRVNSVRHEDDRRPSVTSPPLTKVQSPSQESKMPYGSLTNGHRDSMSSSTTGLATKENTFPDESVAALKVVVRDPDYRGDNESAAANEPVPAPVSGLRGGAGSPEQFDRVRSLQYGPDAPASSKNDDPLYFTQGEGPPPHLLNPGYIWEEYASLRDLAFSQRTQNHFDGALVPLYPLWAEFLSTPNQFNVGMYEDFKTWAIEDEERGNDNGKQHLVKFYDAMLNSRATMSERIANDIVEIARRESGVNRPTWLKLRAAWRNGATNLKTRKRLSDLLTQEEQGELDRGK